MWFLVPSMTRFMLIGLVVVLQATVTSDTLTLVFEDLDLTAVFKRVSTLGQTPMRPSGPRSKPVGAHVLGVPIVEL